MSSLPSPPRNYRQGRAAATSGVGRFAGIPKAERVVFPHCSIVLSRIFAHDIESWVRKGGTALIWHDPLARATRDLDVYNRTAEKIDDALSALRSALMDNSLPAHDVKLHIRVHLISATGIELSPPAKIDPVSGYQVTGTIESEIDNGMDKALQAKFPQVRLYPIGDHLADKVAATRQTYPSDRGVNPSTRIHDLSDITQIALRETITGDELTTTPIDSERFERGLAVYIKRLRCPATWEKLYPKGPRKRGSAPEQFEKALQVAKDLIAPAIFGQASGLTPQSTCSRRAARTPSTRPTI